MSEGCRNCYAEGVAYRFSGPGQPYEGLVTIGTDGKRKRQWNGAIRFAENHFLDPLKWKDPRRIFVNSMSDLFHEGVTDEMLDRIFAVMALCPQHTFQVLTKRPERMLAYFSRQDRREMSKVVTNPAAWHVWRAATAIQAAAKQPIPSRFTWTAFDEIDTVAPWPLPNVQLGVSVENQKAADERIPLLLQTPAAVRFMSAEPLLGPVELPRYVYLPRGVQSDLPWLMGRLYAPAGLYVAHRNPLGAVSVQIEGKMLGIKPDEMESRNLDWVIVGGESGPGARPMHPDWARSLRDQCTAAGVPFFFKQWGEWRTMEGERPRTLQLEAGAPMRRKPDCYSFPGRPYPDNDVALCVGKKAAGRLLDGREWNEMPEVKA